MRYSAILFDLDGTLVDSVADIAITANVMLTKLHLSPLDVTLITSFVGKGIPNLVERCLSTALQTSSPNPALLQQGLNLFLELYHKQLEQSAATLYPGVKEGLEAFKASGAKLALVTNKAIAFVPAILEKAGLAVYFELLIGGDTCTEKKPHPMPFLYACEQLHVAPSDALVIGDSANDSLAANAAGIDVLLVPYGYNEGKSVQTLKCDGIVLSIKDAATWAATEKTN